MRVMRTGLQFVLVFAAAASPAGASPQNVVWSENFEGANAPPGLAGTLYTANPAANNLWHIEGACPNVFHEVLPSPSSFASIVGNPATTPLFAAGTDDATSAVIPFPGGFGFSFFGVAKAGFQVNNNGWVAFDQNLGGGFFTNGALPAAAAPNDAVYAWWDDLVVAAGGSVSYLQLGNSLRIEWALEEHFPGNASGEKITFQVRLTPAQAGNPDLIDLFYDRSAGAFAGGGDPWSATIGVENAAGTAGILIQGPATASLPSTDLRIRPAATPGALPGGWGTKAAAYNTGAANNHYDTPGMANSGGLESPAMPVSNDPEAGSPTLQFEYSKVTEQNGVGDFDQCTVETSLANTGQWTTVARLLGNTPSCSSASPVSVALNPCYATSAWQHRFRFDTVDAQNNAGAGWYVDNVAVTDALQGDPYYNPAAANPIDPAQNPQWYLSRIKAEDAWKLTPGCASAKIAIVDSGVAQHGHPMDANDANCANPLACPQGNNFFPLADLIPPQLGPQKDFTNVPNDLDADDCVGHGSAIHSLLGMRWRNNGMGRGLFPRATFLHGKIFCCAVMTGGASTAPPGPDDPPGSNPPQLPYNPYPGDPSKDNGTPLPFIGPAGADPAVIGAAVDWAVGQGADVLNLSLGGPFPAGAAGAAYAASFAAAEAAGRVVVASAGNDGGAVLTPAALPTVLAVGATNANDVVPNWSNRGAPASPPGIQMHGVDLVAPGEKIGFETVVQCVPCVQPAWRFSKGTSYAAPLVAGVAAMMKANTPAMTPARIRNFLRWSAKPLAAAVPDPVSGWGRLDAGGALAVTPYGSACGKEIGFRGAPRLGETFKVTVEPPAAPGPYPPAPAFLALSILPAAIPVPFTGCTLNVFPFIFLTGFATDPTGYVEAPLAIPNDATLVDGVVYFQWGVLAGGIQATDGLRVQVLPAP